MSERKWFVRCQTGCLAESMTKEQIMTAIEQAISNGEIGDVDTGFITRIKEQNNGAGLSFWVGTSAEYNALDPKINNCFYIITDDTTTEDIERAIAALDKRVETIENKKLGAVLYTSNAYANEGDTIEFDATQHTLFAITLRMQTNSCVIMCGKSLNGAATKIQINGSNVVFGSDKTPRYFSISIKLGSNNKHTIEIARHGTAADYSETGQVTIEEIKGIM